METITGDGRRKLTDDDRRVIHQRYYDRLKTKETVKAIGDAFGISRLWVRLTAEAVEAALMNEKARTSDQVAG